VDADPSARKMVSTENQIDIINRCVIAVIHAQNNPKLFGSALSSTHD
jgi:hypothetical protein